MWLALAFLSAALLGLYDAAKKQSLTGNAVLPVLLLNTLISTLLFAPLLLNSTFDWGWFEGTKFATPVGSINDHVAVALKAVIVLTSWVFGYFGIKHLPITLVGPINATRPVMVLVGAMLFFGERLNGYQWAGVLLSIFSLFLLSRVGRKEGVHFTHNRWIVCVVLSSVVGALSGLYDKYLMLTLDPLFVQSWYNLYQLLIMTLLVAFLWWPRRAMDRFRWSWAIPLISIFLSAADMAYFWALSDQEAMISIVSMVRRSSVIVSFLCGAVLFRERNLRAKGFDLLLILLGMVLLWLGTR